MADKPAPQPNPGPQRPSNRSSEQRRPSEVKPKSAPEYFDPSVFVQRITATLYPIKRTGYNPCFCCESCCCFGHSMVVGSIYVAVLEILTGIAGIMVGIYRLFHYAKTVSPAEHINFVLYETRELFGEVALVLGTAQGSMDTTERPQNQNPLQNTTVVHVGLNSKQLANAQDIMTWYLLAMAFVLVLGGILLTIATLTRNRGIANISLVLHLAVTAALIIYTGIMIMYMSVVLGGKGSDEAKLRIAAPFAIEILIVLISVLTIFGVACSNGLYHGFHTVLPPPLPAPINKNQGGGSAGKVETAAPALNKESLK